ncbi:hypothetical protein B0H11DRAFT_2278072 [Mycena galericulata]|nr:hypothetical protein B0H11DRAFT_2278072 [Mycena galericulata]
MQVTITRLPTAVHIVSIPRNRLPSLSHPILRSLLGPSPAFLSIICNALELSLFADLDPDSLRAFDAISAADHRQGSPTAIDPVEVSRDRWSVLQIDSHSDQLDNAGARVNELSAPLAAAGISILYQSSYMSDFIFVKERRLAEAMGLFAAAGFALYAADPNLLTALLASPPILTRERSATPAPAPRARPSTPHLKSTPSPTPSSPVRAVRILAPDLACVGLADDAADHWALKIVKLVAFPDLIPLPSPRRKHAREADDGYFSHSPSPEPELDADATKDESADVQPSRARPVPSRLDALPSPLAWLPAPPTGAADAVSEEPRPPDPLIPFFSFTRTPEGSSLTAGARVLAALFPRAERHMVICAGELDAVEREAEAEAAVDHDERDSDADADSGSDADADGLDSDADRDRDADADHPPLLCALQVDLRGAGLDSDTSGLVHRFSRALARGGVNHMYASTLRSANLLVPAGRGRTGARLLRAC